MRRWQRLFGPRLMVALLMLAATGMTFNGVQPVAADAQHTAGNYRIALGFNRTPYPEEPLIAYIRVTTLDGAPVTGLEEDIFLRVGIPNQVTETMPVTPVANEPGAYYVDLMLPRAAPYVMQVLGKLGGASINEMFITGKDGLDKVIIHEGHQYPKGSGWVVLFTFGFYIVGLGVFGVRYVLQRSHRPHGPAKAA